MICRLSLTALLTLILTACGAEVDELPPLEQAHAALQRGDGYSAEVRLRELLDTGTPPAELAAYLGKAELEQGNLPEARQWLQSGDFSEATRGLGFHTLGRVEMADGNFPAAGLAFDRAYEFIPNDPGLWVDIGRLRYRGGAQTQAIEASIRAAELGPQHPRALQFRAQLVRDSRGLREALEWFERAVAATPDDPELLADYAATLGELGRAREMLEIVRRIAVIDPANRQMLYLQAVLAARAGDWSLAQTLLTRSGHVERGIPAALMLSGIVDLENGNAASAAQAFGRLEAMQPENRRVRLLLARSLDQAGNHAELLARFRPDAELPNASPYLLMLVGRAYEAQGQREEAAQFLDRAAQARSGNLVALRGDMALGVLRNRGELAPGETLALVRDLIVSGERAEAARRADAFLRDHPGSADAMALAGDALLANYRIEAALAHYRKSADIRLPWPLARKMIYALNAAQRPFDARNLLERHLAGDPFNAEAANLLARAEFDAGRFARAAILADHAIEIGGGRDPYLLALRAQIALRGGEAGSETGSEIGAETFARRARSLQPLNRAANDTLALVLAQQQAAPGAATR